MLLFIISGSLLEGMRVAFTVLSVANIDASKPMSCHHRLGGPVGLYFPSVVCPGLWSCFCLLGHLVIFFIVHLVSDLHVYLWKVFVGLQKCSLPPKRFSFASATWAGLSWSRITFIQDQGLKDTGSTMRRADSRLHCASTGWIWFPSISLLCLWCRFLGSSPRHGMV